MEYIKNSGDLMEKKILIGMNEIVNTIAIYKKELKKMGHEVKTIVAWKNRFFLNEKYDHVIFENIRDYMGNYLVEKILKHIYLSLKLIMLLFKYINKYNIYIFIFNKSFLPLRLDYLLLKLLGKIIVSDFRGCDIRHWEAYESMANKYHVTSICIDCEYKNTYKCSYTRKKLLAIMSEKFSDIIFTSKIDSQLLSKPFFYIGIPIELDKYNFKIPKNKIPVIVHAPSNRAIKGTKYILDTLNRLEKDGYKFKLVLLENQPNEIVRKELSEADIVIDQLFSIGPAAFSLEAMASGCAVLTGYKEEFFPAKCPVVPIAKNNIYEKIKYLLDNKKEIYKYAVVSRRYVEKYHDSKTVVENLLNIIEGYKTGPLMKTKI